MKRGAVPRRSASSDPTDRPARRRPNAAPQLAGRPARPGVSLAAAVRQYNRHLDQTVTLVASLVNDDVSAEITSELHGLLESKETELRVAGDLLEEKFRALESALAVHGTPSQQAEFAVFLRDFRAGHASVRDDVMALAKPASRSGAAAAARRLLRDLKDQKRSPRNRVRGQRIEAPKLPSAPIEFQTAPPPRESTLRPAYLGGSFQPMVGGPLDPTPEVQLTPEIQALAADLGNSPFRIYDFVRNNTTFEPYFGSLN